MFRKIKKKKLLFFHLMLISIFISGLPVHTLGRHVDREYRASQRGLATRIDAMIVQMSIVAGNSLVAKVPLVLHMYSSRLLDIGKYGYIMQGYVKQSRTILEDSDLQCMHADIDTATDKRSKVSYGII